MTDFYDKMEDPESTPFDSLIRSLQTTSLAERQRYGLARLIRTEEDARTVFRIVAARIEREFGGVEVADGEAVGKMHLDDEVMTEIPGFSVDDRNNMVSGFWEAIWNSLDMWDNAPEDHGAERGGHRDAVLENFFPVVLEYVEALESVYDVSLEFELLMLNALKRAFEEAT
jgi:hypothetical protein